jgi:hypothetical protein
LHFCAARALPRKVEHQKMSHRTELKHVAEIPGPISGAAAAATAVAFLALAFCFYGLSWNSESAGFLSDDAIYLLMADCFGAHADTSPGLADYVMHQSLFPPLYPLLLAAFDAGSQHLLRAHMVTTTTLLMALLVYGAWVRSQTRESIGAIGLMFALALLPGMLFQNIEIFSEPAYLLFSLLACWQADGEPASRRTVYLTALCVALTALTRTMGFSLLSAFGLWLWRRRGGRIASFALAVAPALIWSAYKRWGIGSQSSYDQNWQWIWEQFRAQPAYAGQFLAQQMRSMWQSLLPSMDIWQSRTTCVILAATLLVALPMWVRRLRQWRLDALYLLASVGLILIYPFPSAFGRLLLPLLPMLLFYCYAEIGRVTSRWGNVSGKPALAYGYVAVVLMMVLPSLIFTANRFFEPIATPLASWRHSRYWYRPWSVEIVRSDIAFRQHLIDALRDTRQRVPESDCIFGVHTAIGMLYARRVFVQPPPPRVDAEEFDRRMKGCSYAFLMPVRTELGGEPADAFYPKDRLTTGAYETVHVWDDPNDQRSPIAILVHLKPALAPGAPTT